MSIIKRFEELFEKKVVIKRKYTDLHPEKTISSNAKIRNTVLNSIAYEALTEEDFVNVLTSANPHKGWLNKNKSLFKIHEDKDGVKTYSLSQHGKKVYSAILKNTQLNEDIINEALNVPYPNRGLKKVNVFAGRFQPFTLGHVKVFEQMYKENGLPTVVLIVRSNKNKEKAPFSEDTQIAMFEKMKGEYKFLEAVRIINKAGIDDIFSAVRPAYEPILWGFGTDRKKNFEYMINHESYREQLGVDPEFSGFEIKRGDEDISATKVRESLMNDDELGFKKLTPRSIHGMYTALKNEINPLQESFKTFKDYKNI